MVAPSACTPETLRKVEHTADRVTAVIGQARNAGNKACDVAVPACSAYYDAVRAGLVHDDDRAELACAKASNVCALLDASGAGGAP